MPSRIHIPVLLQEVLYYLDPKSGKRYLDATIGMAGHARAIAELGASVLGVDSDRSVIAHLIGEFAKSNLGVKVVRAPFDQIENVVKEQNFLPLDGILFDLGLGSHQLDEANRGFSFQKDGPLDMRFDQDGNELTAYEIVNQYPEDQLIKIFREYGEEKRFAKKIAREIVFQRKDNLLSGTSELFALIKRSLPGKMRYKSGDVARKIFQSLRIAVNDELDKLERALPQALSSLHSGGRLVVISFHSLEDRIVKNFFNEEAKDCICPPEIPVCRCDKKSTLKILTPKPIRASLEETKTNPRASSAKLRAAEKI